MSVPILMITCGRFNYTVKAIEALFKCNGVSIYIFDNGSDAGIRGYLFSVKFSEQQRNDTRIVRLHLSKNNLGIAAAMNWFLNETKDCQYVAKCDNDTIVPPDFIEKMLPHMDKADIVQAKHKLIEASKVGTFDEWTSKMPADGALRFNHFVGGSGVLFKRQLVNHIPETESKIMGWRQFQRDHPELKKAFATDVEIELLDQDGYPKEYESYYQQTGRI